MATEITEETPSQPQRKTARKEKPPLKNKKPWDLNRRDKQELILRSAAAEEVKFAAISINYNVRLNSSDMSVAMQDHALRIARSLVDSAPKLPLNNTHLARTLKKEFDSVYGPAWHCVVGKSFGSFVTHSSGAFIYFSVDSISIILFQSKLKFTWSRNPNLIINCFCV